jgi:hypothetical protein
MKRFILVIVVFLAGCGGAAYSASRIAVLQNLETKQTVECRVNPWGSLNNRLQIDNCIAVYEKAGYKLMSDSANLAN